ncbi:Nuclear-interacting partner of ALK [Chamberlinius hualienensis]
MDGLENRKRKAEALEEKFDVVSKILKRLSDSGGSSSVENDQGNHSEEYTDFCERLMTFNRIGWSLMPLSVSPLVCARLGWKVIQPQILKCVGCAKILCSKMPNLDQQNCYKRSLEKLEKALNESHEKNCPWPFKNLPENYLTEILLHPDKCVEDFQKRLATFTTVKFKLPEIAKDIPDDLKLCIVSCKSFVAKLSDEFESIGDEEITLSLTGWKLNTSSLGLTRLHCDHCLRVIDPLAYEDNKKNSQEDLDSSESNLSKSQIKALSPLNSHQRWCPWIREISVEDERQQQQQQQGWLHLCKTIISQDQRLPDTPRNIVLKVKKIMKQWT